MLRCPRCDQALPGNGEPAGLCPGCGFAAKNIEGFVSFVDMSESDTEFYDPVGLDHIARQEQQHFWFTNRQRYVLRLFERYVPKQAEVMEIGAGTGRIAQALDAAGYQVSIGEIHLAGLRCARRLGFTRLYQLDITRCPFDEAFDAVGLFDVLEHVQDDRPAIRNLYRLLRPGGFAIVTVPAHEWLWNRHDALAYHKRRYSRRDLQAKFLKAGFRIVEASYFFVSILPLLLLRRLLQPDHGAPPTRSEIEQTDIGIGAVPNLILDRICRVEFALLPFFSPPMGGSISLVARKPDR